MFSYFSAGAATRQIVALQGLECLGILTDSLR